MTILLLKSTLWDVPSSWNDVPQWKMSVLSWGLWKGHWAHFVKCLFACKVHNFRVIFKNIRLILDSFWSYKMQGLQNFQGLGPLDPLGGLKRPRPPAVSGNDRWSLHNSPPAQCEYSVITRDMDFSFLPLTGHQLLGKFLLTGQELFSMGLSHRTPIPYSQ